MTSMNGMTKKETSVKFLVPKNTLPTWIKNKDKFFSAFQETSSSNKKWVAVIRKKQTRKCVIGLFLKKPANTINGVLLKENIHFYAESILKLQMDGWKSGKNGKRTSTLFLDLY